MPLTQQQATAGPRLLSETPGHSQASLDQSPVGSLLLLWGPGAHKVLLVPSKSLFPQSCVSSGSSIVGLMVISSKRAYATPRSAAPRAPAPCGRPLLTHTSAGDTQALKGRSGSVSVGFPGVHKVLFEPSECLWHVWVLILNEILPLLPSCWGFSFVLGHAVPFFGGIQCSAVHGCSAASCNSGVLAGDECMPFYSATFLNVS